MIVLLLENENEPFLFNAVVLYFMLLLWKYSLTGLDIISSPC